MKRGNVPTVRKKERGNPPTTRKKKRGYPASFISGGLTLDQGYFLAPEGCTKGTMHNGEIHYADMLICKHICLDKCDGWIDVEGKLKVVTRESPGWGKTKEEIIESNKKVRRTEPNAKS